MLKTDNGRDFVSALDQAFAAAPLVRRVLAGIFEIDLLFADLAAEADFSSAFPEPDRPERAEDARIAILSGPSAHLEALVPSPRTLHFHFDDQRFYALWQPEPADVLQIFDRQTRRGLMWLPNEHHIQSFHSRPILPLIHAMAATGPWTPVHAGAVGLDGRFLLLVGPSKTGKTTASLACAAAGWTYAGDDFVLINPGERTLAPLYASARLRPSMLPPLENIARLAQIGTSNDYNDPRHELRLSAARTGSAVGGGRIAALLLPQRRGAPRPQFQRASASAAFSAMFTVTMAQMPGLLDTVAPKLLRAAKMAPVFAVDTGDDPTAIPEAFRTFLEDLA